jgi:hypothetical protein
MSMDYRGVDISNIGTNPPSPIGGFMKYKGNWNTNLNYNIDDYVVYNRISYIALQDSQSSQPDINPLIWNVVSYWSNSNNVTNFRGYFTPFIQMQQYDSVQDSNTRVTYVYLGVNRYTTTTLQDLINTCPVLQNAPQLQQQLQTPCFFGYSGNGTDIESGALLFPQDPAGGSPIIQSDLAINIPVLNQMFSFRNNNTVMTLDQSLLQSKEGLYKISATFLMWIYQNPYSYQPPNDIFNNFAGGYFQIAKLEGGTTRTGIVTNRVGTYKAVTTIPPTFNIFYYPTSITLECIVPLKFRDAIVLNCTNVSLTDYGFAICPTLNVIYLGPNYDPIL